MEDFDCKISHPSSSEDVFNNILTNTQISFIANHLANSEIPIPLEPFGDDKLIMM